MNKPNLLYIFPDQFRQMSMSLWNELLFKEHCSGKPDPVYTPNLDEFAQQAYLLPNAVSNCPVCSPHRGSLFTGQYPNRSGVPLNCNSDRVISDLPASATCFTDILAQSGYHVGYIGKWHLDLPTPNAPDKPGEYVDSSVPAWDSYTEPQRRHGIHYWYGYGTFDEHRNPHYYDTDGVRHEPGTWSAEHETDKAIAYLKNENAERDPSSPFALFVSMNPPHSPYQSLEDCREQDLKLYESCIDEQLLVRDNAKLDLDKAASARYYFANVSGVDQQFGRIIETLKEIGEWDNTIVVFTSDHGETLCSQGLTDAKNVIFEEAFLVPFLVKYVEQKLPKVSETFLNSADIMPTVLDMLGLKERVPTDITGQSKALSITDDKKSPHSNCALYIRNLDGEKDENGKVVSYFPQSRGIRTDRYTFALEIDRKLKLDSILLFDNKRDPYQLANIAWQASASLTQELLSQLAAELARIQDPWAELKILNDILPYPHSKDC
ncbi:sulfatase [Vibrio sp. Y2-5]|uniref:sulfatase family protein n=1 Tax=Vibrio sp. Y2-5 TaxID=2743977 RepID=UPI001661516E|nr:sulfatase [Vibrio sp. Y2-5]MBD0786476.1 sulfatase [Vibrio sp. Y2-5]